MKALIKEALYWLFLAGLAVAGAWAITQLCKPIAANLTAAIDNTKHIPGYLFIVVLSGWSTIMVGGKWLEWLDRRENKQSTPKQL